MLWKASKCAPNGACRAVSRVAARVALFGLASASPLFAQPPEPANTVEDAARVLSQAERTHGATDEETVRAAERLAFLTMTDGRPDEAIALRERVVERLDAAPGPRDETARDFLAALGDAYLHADRLEDYEAARLQLIAWQRAALGPDDIAPLRTRARLAQTLMDSAVYDAAERQFAILRPPLEEQLGPDHPIVREAAYRHANLLHRQRRLAEAEAILAPLMAGREDAGAETDGREATRRIAEEMLLGLVYFDQGRTGMAAPLLNDALARSRAIHGEAHPSTLALLHARARVAQRSMPDEAEPLFREALDAHRTHLGADHPETLSVMSNFAGHYANRRDFEAAGELIRAVGETQSERLGRRHPATLMTMHNLGQLHARMGDAEGAEPLFAEALAGNRRIYGMANPVPIYDAFGLALVRLMQDEAAPEAIGPARLMIEGLRTRRHGGPVD